MTEAPQGTATWRITPPPAEGRRWRLLHHLVGLVLIALLPVAVIGAVMLADQAREARRFTRERLAERAASLALALDREIEAIGIALATIATAPGLRPGEDRAAFTARAKAIEAAIDNAFLIHDPPEASAPSTPEVLRRVFAERRHSIARSSDRGAVRAPGLSVYEPVADGERVHAVLEMTMTEEQVAAVLAVQNRGAEDIGLLLDPAGLVAGAAGNGALESSATIPLWLLSGRTDRLREGDWPDGTVRQCMTAEPERAPGWAVAVCALRDSEEAAWRSALRERAATLAASLVLGLVAAALLGRRLSRPLAALTDHAVAVAGQAATGPPVPASRVIEFEALRVAVRDAEATLRRQGTAEHLAMLQARTVQRLLTSVLNGAAEGIHVKDLDGRYVMMNQAARTALGLGSDESAGIGQHPRDLMEADAAEALLAADAAVLAADAPRSFEITRLVRGEPRWFALTKTPWRDASGAPAGIVTVSRDVTEARLAEQRLRALQADLSRATRLSSMGAMASGLAHDLSQPLAAASNFLNAALRLLDRAGDGPAPKAARDAIAEGAAQTTRAGAIVHRLREFMERGAASLRAEPIAEVIAEAAALARADGGDHGIPVNVTAPGATTPEGTAAIDRTQMQQVLSNLIRNAAEAIDSRGRRADDRIRIEARRDGAGRMEIAVTDSGPGVDPALANELFQPFVGSRPDGLGIGLAICRSIIEGHGGTLNHEAPAAGGARFVIRLPPEPGEHA